MLDAAVRVFARVGFHDASMDDVAAQAGVSKPMVYTHGGGSKEELLRRCIHREADRLLGSVSQAAEAGGGDAEARLRNGVRAFFATLTTHHEGWSVLYRQARAGTLADEVHEARSRIVGRVAELLTAELAPGPDFSSSGHPAADGTGPDPVALVTPVAAALVGAAEGLADWSAGGGLRDPDALAGMLMTLVWPGLDGLRRAPEQGPAAGGDGPAGPRLSSRQAD